jgi:hypothetical protein
LFESDFYAGIQKKVMNFFPRKRSIWLNSFKIEF